MSPSWPTKGVWESAALLRSLKHIRHNHSPSLDNSVRAQQTTRMESHLLSCLPIIVLLRLVASGHLRLFGEGHTLAYRTC
jgi:hypothetical protein